MQTAIATGSTGQLIYFAFDLLSLDGVDLRGETVVERKRQLKTLLAKSQSRIQFAEHVVGNGPAFFKAGCQAGLEGIICKRADATYQSGRTKSWLKVKCILSDEFLVGGFTLGAGSRTGFGALLLGERNDDGDLIYTGRVGTGFDERTLIDLRRRLDPLQRSTPPFAKKPPVPGRTFAGRNLFCWSKSSTPNAPPTDCCVRRDIEGSETISLRLRKAAP